MYERGETMVYRIRRIKLDNMAEICWRAERCETYLTLQNLHIGGIYQLHGGKLYVVESKESWNVMMTFSPIESAKVIRVIEIREVRGSGATNDPVRVATSYWSLDGKKPTSKSSCFLT